MLVLFIKLLINTQLEILLRYAINCCGEAREQYNIANLAKDQGVGKNGNSII